MFYQMPKSQRGADKQWNAIIRAYRRNFAGGGMFGFDWPTMRLNAPEAFAHLRKLQEVYKTLPI